MLTILRNLLLSAVLALMTFGVMITFGSSQNRQLQMHAVLTFAADVICPPHP